MRELFGLRSVKAAGSCLLAGTLLLSLYAFSTPGRSIETHPVDRAGANRAGADRAGAALSGHATVVDGDTIEIAGVRVRLEGIDAPESDQRCPHPVWRAWPAGHRASRTLARLIDGRVVSCRRRGRDAYGRMLGVCRVGNLELNSEMVRRGLAWAFVRYSRTYVAVERQARAAGAGVWQRPCTPAWIYRRARWQSEAAQAPRGCAIKGNITPAGRLYHMPWSPWYSKTEIEPERGERWFCDEREALAAGWRPASPGY